MPTMRASAAELTIPRSNSGAQKPAAVDTVGPAVTPVQRVRSQPRRKRCQGADGSDPAAHSHPSRSILPGKVVEPIRKPVDSAADRRIYGCRCALRFFDVTDFSYSYGMPWRGESKALFRVTQDKAFRAKVV